MNQKLSIIVSTWCIFPNFPINLHAQPAKSTTADGQSLLAQPKAAMHDRQEERASTTAALQEIKTERKAAFSQAIQRRVTNLASNISNRVDAAITRLQAIADRIESRINKLQADGVDMTDAKSSLEQARAALDEARTGIADIDTQVAQAVTSENPRQEWSAVKTTFLNVKIQLQSAKSLLNQCVMQMKQAVSDGKTSNNVSDSVSQKQSTSTNN